MDRIFKDTANISIAALNKRCENTLNTPLGIVFTEIGDNFLKATMPVNSNTCQPLGMLNGGASLALIETVGSMAANLALDRNQFVAVGQQVNANHFKPAYKGETVVGTATPIHIGRTSQVWEVLVEGLSGTVHCKGTITMAVLPLERLRG